MMKDSNAPRRVYTRNDVIHVCFGGKTFAPVGGDTEIKVGAHVKVEVGDNGSATITWKRPKQKAITETWKARKVPVNPRSA